MKMQIRVHRMNIDTQTTPLTRFEKKTKNTRQLDLLQHMSVNKIVIMRFLKKYLNVHGKNWFHFLTMEIS